MSVVLKYDYRFFNKVINGDKRTTIRRRKTAFKGARLVHVFVDDKGNKIKVSGMVCHDVVEVSMSDAGMKLNGVALAPARIHDIAINDGFDSVGEFREFFKTTYGFPFHGELITW